MSNVGTFSMFSLRDKKSDIVTRHFSSATELILQLKVLKGSKIRERRRTC